MFFRGTHRTTYRYTEPVFLEPHTIRLRPRSDPRQTVHAFDIGFSPEPDGTTHGIDAFGNSVVFAWFSGSHEALEITTRFLVETLRDNPFDYILPTAGDAWLWPVYTEAERDVLGVYLRPQVAPSAAALANEIAAATGHQLVPFLSELAARIQERCETIYRAEGDPWSAEETLQKGTGSCRDLAVVYVEACRNAGVAARFVSGYQEGDPNADRELHAWAGAYVPGAGWRGYDPTLGLAVADRHVTVAVGATPAGAAPATGTFRATGADATLEASIDLETTEERPD